VRSILQSVRLAATFALITLAAVEIGARVVPGWWFEDWPSRDEILQTLERSEEDGSARRSRSNALHPYLGWVRNPARIPRRVGRRLPGASINELGFFGPSPLVRGEGQDDVARVVITGGSVAEEFYLYAGDAFARELEASGRFGGRSVEVLSLAMAGFKQPQQLMALSYVLLLGAEFDAVVNLDGFNEVALPYTENVPQKISPIYPFRWNALASDAVDPESSRLIARIDESQARLESWRGFFSFLPLRHSAFALASWHALKSRSDAARAGLEVELRESLRASLADRPVLRGPRFEFGSDADLFDRVVDLWRRASIQLWQLCRFHGIEYIHALQPNQYVPGSKSFSPPERRVALLPAKHRTRVSVEAGYPRMIAAGADLADLGVRFVDLTAAFRDVPEPIYRDSCCHYNDRGYLLLARRLAAAF